MTLPHPGIDQSYCNVSALEAGHIELPLEMVITPANPGAIDIVPSLSFLIEHSKTRNKFIFDLGIRRDWENYTPSDVQRIKNVCHVQVPQDVVDSLRKGGDTGLFSQGTFIVGAESALLFRPGYPEDANSSFATALLPPERTLFLSSAEWPSLGPFPRALDFYGDGSLYIVDAPGHLPGHINILVRTSPDGGWIYLAGDSAHNWKLVTGEAEIAVGHPGHPLCLHADKALSEQHILRIRALLEIPRVRVMLAHDSPWYAENKGGPAFWPGRIPSL